MDAQPPTLPRARATPRPRDISNAGVRAHRTRARTPYAQTVRAHLIRRFVRATVAPFFFGGGSDRAHDQSRPGHAHPVRRAHKASAHGVEYPLDGDMDMGWDRIDDDASIRIDARSRSVGRDRDRQAG